MHKQKIKPRLTHQQQNSAYYGCTFIIPSISFLLSPMLAMIRIPPMTDITCWSLKRDSTVSITLSITLNWFHTPV